MTLKKIVLFLFISLVLMNRDTIMYAQSNISQCGGDNPASATVVADVTKYDIYAKLGKKDVTEPVSMHVQSHQSRGSSEGCQKISTQTIDDKRFTKIAAGVIFPDETIVLYLSSKSVTGDQTAAGPQLILVNSESTICKLEEDCKVNYAGQSMKLSPKKISLTTDSIKVGLLLPVTNENISKTLYSVDERVMYESKDLQPFNEKYVSGGEHILSRKVIFENGASLSEDVSVEKGTIADIQYLFQSVLFGQSKILELLFLAASLLIVLVIIKKVIISIEKKRVWKQTHIASMSGYRMDTKRLGAQRNFYSESTWGTIYRYKRWIGGVLGIGAGVFIITTYVVTTFTVDGVSMSPTLRDGAVYPLIKVERTIASVTNATYIPKRGKVVVVNVDENNLFDPIARTRKSYVVKRVVGIPGDRVVVSGGKIMIFNDEHKDGYEPDSVYGWTSLLAGSEEFSIDLVLKQDEIFVVGDHRNESVDSRFYGPVDAKDIVGYVVI